ncbi:hypothetical protein L208DRAFT_401747 [Tricholoma matsutake]|nr:hypothetical protein L208DRAFT_401747 [Tricholoma matsutake 945]
MSGIVSSSWGMMSATWRGNVDGNVGSSRVAHHIDLVVPSLIYDLICYQSIIYCLHDIKGRPTLGGLWAG